MSGGGTLRTFLIYILVASVFLYLPDAIDILIETSFGGKMHPLAYDTTQNSVVPYDIKLNIMRLVQIVGLVSFLRGWLILAQSAKQGSQSSTSKAITHIVAGILAINIQGTQNIIFNTFGIT